MDEFAPTNLTVAPIEEFARWLGIACELGAFDREAGRVKSLEQLHNALAESGIITFSHQALVLWYAYSYGSHHETLLRLR